MLKVSNLQAGYGESQVLFGIDFEIQRGEVVTLLGRNGMGKTTTVSSLMGIVRPCGGAIVFNGKSIFGSQPYEVARAGLGLVPEGRQVFPNLTVQENLLATASAREGDGTWVLESVLALFPGLVPRLHSMAGLLSGGEQQMLAVGRALMTNPSLLVLDEATEGLAPLIRNEIWRVLQTLRNAGQSILIIDKNVDALARLADRHYILEKGRIMWSGTSPALLADGSLRQRFLGV
ncbi:MAG TPA: ABC transporter ATP-binding protein [Eoetvoesiella sp.]|uniref:ABC transporter ATP-binding protein n=1 Tax=Eoetvoesiella sp. TaxID=1966355 RepID=UPI002C675759|nr:ABC transporter ATP-binding protein [Eoetvoesiella sp.]HWK60581.1 ABC transporter ATP-binding protein [Eoetvoesiella sp.]